MKSLRKKFFVIFLASLLMCTFFAFPVSAAWKKDNTGWWYQYNDGSYPKGSWAKIDGHWYLFDSSGYMKTGWQNVNGIWYYLNPSGEMKTGWLKDGEIWYYLDSSGAMVTGTKTINGAVYHFDSNGKWIENEDAESGGIYVVFWGKSGNKYHIDPECYTFQGNETFSGTIEEAKAHERIGWCGICSKGWYDKRLNENGNPFVK